MSDNLDGFGILDRSLADIAAAASPSDVFRAVLDGCRAASPRAVLFLARGGVFKGWGSTGYPSPSSGRCRDRSIPFDSASVSPVLSEPAGFLSLPGSPSALGDLGLQGADEAAALLVRIGERPVALVVAERAAGESPWQPAALRILGHAARLRLELDLAWRRLKIAPRHEAEEAPPAVEAAAPVAAWPDPPVDRSDPVLATGLEPAEAAVRENPALDQAWRFARLVATEIRMYNEESVLLGRKQGDLRTRLADSIEQGRATFERRFPDLGAEGARILDEAYLQVLAGGNASLLPGR